MSNKKSLRWRLPLIIILIIVIAISGYKIYDYLSEISTAVKETDSLAEIAVSEAESGEAAPISVDFDKLLSQNADIIAWIYCEDTPINYPIVQASDNSYYLRRLTDGSYNRAGTLFMDCNNKSDFSDLNSVIYGHNMKTDIMFGTLPEYEEQSYYDEHPVMWLFTPQQNYKIELFAAFLTSAGSEIYEALDTEEQLGEYIADALAESDFKAEIDPTGAEHIITLSTCSYEYNNARYVLIGVLSECN
ncbi:MAG: class B sortase [Clostridiales bacterium]|nr:class B sortase [Clostridiales bacterium]